MQRVFGRFLILRRQSNRVPPLSTFQDVVSDGAKMEEYVEVESRTEIEGYLFKRASNIFKTWNRRWFVIQNNQLMYYTKFKCSPIVVIEDLQLCTVEECENNGRQFCFQVVSPTKTYMLQTDTGEKRQAWITVIQNITANSDEREHKSELLDKVMDLGVWQKQISRSKDPQRESKTGHKASVVKKRRTGNLPIQRTYSASKENFDCKYTIGNMLGQGGYGYVFDGFRKADGKQVAIKYVKKSWRNRLITIPGETEILPVEVALMQMVSKPPHCRHVLELLEWFDMPENYLFVLEQPVPCMNLYQYRRDGRLHESVAQIIMWQVVVAARHCRDRGVLHRDIKEENVLINVDSLEVKLIDFGCGDLLMSTPYRKYLGTMQYSPPEWITQGKYSGCSSTVWSLGVFLFRLMCGKLPFFGSNEIAEGNLIFPSDVSKACCDLIRSCLAKNPYSRPSLEMILQHNWFQE